MFEMPKMEMVEFEVEEIMTVSPAEPSSAPASSEYQDPDLGEWD